VSITGSEKINGLKVNSKEVDNKEVNSKKVSRFPVDFIITLL